MALADGARSPGARAAAAALPHRARPAPASRTVPADGHAFNCGRCLELFPGDYAPYADAQAGVAGGQFFNFWHPGVAYAAGNVVAPTTYNGFVFRALNTAQRTPEQRADGAPLAEQVERDGQRQLHRRIPAMPRLEGRARADVRIRGRRHGRESRRHVAGKRNPWPLQDRGFDDPQADPDPSFIPSGNTCGPAKNQPCKIYISYKRADLWAFPNPLPPPTALPPPNPLFPYRPKRRTRTRQPAMGLTAGLRPRVESSERHGRRRGRRDTGPPPDRHNRGAFAAYLQFRPLPVCPAVPQRRVRGAVSSCARSAQLRCLRGRPPCGGWLSTTAEATLPARRSRGRQRRPVPALRAGHGAAGAGEFWPLVPFPRDWAPYKTSDCNSATAIKRLLRFASSIVSFDSTKDYMSEYSLAEDSSNVVVVSPATPIAGSLRDAYNYFKNTVFAQNDPFADCRL